MAFERVQVLHHRVRIAAQELAVSEHRPAGRHPAYDGRVRARPGCLDALMEYGINDILALFVG